MKFILIAAVALLALAHGSYAQDTIELEKLRQVYEDVATKVTHELTELLKNQELSNTAQTFIQDRREQLEPLVAQFQNQMKAVASSVEEQMRPMAASVQAQAQPLFESLQQQFEAALKKLVDQTQAIAN